MTARTVQPTTTNPIPREQAQSNAVEMRLKLDASKTFFEPIGDRRVDQHTATGDMATDRKKLWPKLLRIKIAAALSWQPPRLPHAIQLISLAAMIHVPTEGCVTLRDLGETTNNPPLRLWQNVTGCSAGSAAFLGAESLVLTLQKSDNKFVQVPAQLSLDDRLWGQRQKQVATGCHLRSAGMSCRGKRYSTLPSAISRQPAVTSEQPGMPAPDRRC